MKRITRKRPSGLVHRVWPAIIKPRRREIRGKTFHMQISATITFDEDQRTNKQEERLLDPEFTVGEWLPEAIFMLTHPKTRDIELRIE